MELDELIGEIRREAARRRAAPDFPLDDEARIGAAMDRLGPVGSAADLAAIIARLRALPAEGAGLGEVAGLAASAANALAARLDHLERRVRREHPPGAAVAPPVPAGAEPSPSIEDLEAVAAWLERPGPVLVCGAGAEEWVTALVGSGGDAYGLDPSRDPFGDAGRTRHGQLGEHLRSVPAGALAGVVVVGPARVGEGTGGDAWTGELARVTSQVAVCSESPWWWRQRLGDEAADLAVWRPLSPERWLAGLHRSGFAVAGWYGAGGRSYRLLAALAPAQPS